MLVGVLVALLLVSGLVALFVARTSRRVGTVERDVPREYAEPGHCVVVLGDAGSRRPETIAAIREVTDVGHAQARDWAEGSPCAIAGGLSRASAERVRQRLEQAGATAWVEG